MTQFTPNNIQSYYTYMANFDNFVYLSSQEYITALYYDPTHATELFANALATISQDITLNFIHHFMKFIDLSKKSYYFHNGSEESLSPMEYAYYFHQKNIIKLFKLLRVPITDKCEPLSHLF